MADDLPAVEFGPNRIRTFTLTELENIVDLPRLRRTNHNWAFDAAAFSRFSWLIVEETYPLDREPGHRAIPVLFDMVDLNRDWGRIEPHRERFPRAAEAALFAVLLAPWEDWVREPQIDWCGFRVPWVYTADSDIFVRPNAPTSPETLSWEPDFFHDADGNVVLETERPFRLPLKDTVTEASAWLSDEAYRWSKLNHSPGRKRAPMAG
jgi:hypothetical protein